MMTTDGRPRAPSTPTSECRIPCTRLAVLGARARDRREENMKRASRCWWTRWIPGALALAVAAAWPAAPAMAQGPREHGMERREPRERSMERTKRGGSMRDSILLLYLDGLRKRLELSNEETLGLLPMFEKIEDLRADHNDERKQQWKALVDLADDPATPDTEILKAIKGLQASDDTFRVEENRLKDKIAAGLTVRQQAQFIVFHAHFQERLRDLVEQRRRTVGMDRPGGGPDRPEAP